MGKHKKDDRCGIVKYEPFYIELPETGLFYSFEWEVLMNGDTPSSIKAYVYINPIPHPTRKKRDIPHTKIAVENIEVLVDGNMASAVKLVNAWLKKMRYFILEQLAIMLRDASQDYTDLLEESKDE